MRTRLLGFTAALMLAALGAVGPVAQAAVPAVTAIGGPACVKGGGTVEYDSGAGIWKCVRGSHDGESIN
ncbi:MULTISPECIES: hypothetical protein [unclassified Streptomyces]|uniref:hypothetical protein n=1 Tax=unclassified Streptomyces TaxID=2593676 RepID=UPI001BED20F4|nr:MULTISPECIES: hypothetical protein [unclassified Streptomyces]MBT2408107.1 hypothetical protein [Streptomyces sp. ISL-21]MBT2455617.1 hypothetical protein [Streptomyces sp. ISL-86]MBT2609557.1 hypothetical protein [Streptomyces sp. ISL-87]